MTIGDCLLPWIPYLQVLTLNFTVTSQQLHMNFTVASLNFTTISCGILYCLIYIWQNFQSNSTCTSLLLHSSSQLFPLHFTTTSHYATALHAFNSYITALHHLFTVTALLHNNFTCTSPQLDLQHLHRNITCTSPLPHYCCTQLLNNFTYILLFLH